MSPLHSDGLLPGVPDCTRIKSNAETGGRSGRTGHERRVGVTEGVTEPGPYKVGIREKWSTGETYLTRRRVNKSTEQRGEGSPEIGLQWKSHINSTFKDGC